MRRGSSASVVRPARCRVGGVAWRVSPAQQGALEVTSWQAPFHVKRSTPAPSASHRRHPSRQAIAWARDKPRPATAASPFPAPTFTRSQSVSAPSRPTRGGRRLTSLHGAAVIGGSSRAQAPRSCGRCHGHWRAIGAGPRRNAHPLHDRRPPALHRAPALVTSAGSEQHRLCKCQTRRAPHAPCNCSLRTGLCSSSCRCEWPDSVHRASPAPSSSLGLAGIDCALYPPRPCGRRLSPPRRPSAATAVARGVTEQPSGSGVSRDASHPWDQARRST